MPIACIYGPGVLDILDFKVIPNLLEAASQMAANILLPGIPTLCPLSGG